MKVTTQTENLSQATENEHTESKPPQEHEKSMSSPENHLNTSQSPTSEKSQPPREPLGISQDIDSLSGVLGLLARHLDPNAQAEAQVKAQKRENQFPPRISALNPQGDKDYPRPKLPYRKIFVPYEAEPSDFTYEELELMSRLKTGTYTIKRNDRSTAEIVVEITKNAISGEPENLHIVSEIGFNNENRHLMPPMADYLRQILGEDASDIMTMDDRQRFVLEGALAVSVGQ